MKNLKHSNVLSAFILFSIIFFSDLANTYADESQSQRLEQGWEFVKGDLGGVWEALRIENSSNLPVWEKVTLPHSYNALDGVDPDVPYYQGPGWYRILLDLKNPYPGGRTILHFEGSGQKTDVYVFQTHIGRHVGGYDEFWFDITEAVDQFRKSDFSEMYGGKIPFVVRTDNSRDVELIPSDLSDFNLYGGIYRYVNLRYVPVVSLEMVHINPVAKQPYQKADIQIKARIYNPCKHVKPIAVTYEITDRNGKIVASGTTTQLAWNGFVEIGAITLANPNLWSTSDPALYNCKVSISMGDIKHTTTQSFGIRDFEFKKNGPFYLNGERLFIKGTHRHEDHAGVGPAMTEGLMRQEMEMMKEMGVNFIRLGHYQQSGIILDLCDELGILVWEEIPWCRGGLGGEIFREQSRRMLTNMIEQHYNHPSVIIWGLGNENDWPGDFDVFDEHEIRAFMKELHDLSYQLDSSRKTGIRRADFLKDVIDVYSPSIWAGWYRGIYQDYKPASLQWIKDVDHFFHMEWGGDSHPGRFSENPEKELGHIAPGDVDERHGDFQMTGGLPRASRDGDWSESYMVNLFDWHLKEMETMPNLTGAAQWPFKDFSTPLRPENPVPYVNQKGVVQRDLTPKESFYVFQSYWTEEPMVHIYGHAWTTRWGKNNEPKLVKVFSNCEQAELFVNGESQGIKQRNSQDFPAAGLRWMVRYNEGENHLRVVAQKGDVVVEDQIYINYQTEPWGEPATLRLELVSQSADTAEVRVLMLDENAVICLNTANIVNFHLTGDGRLIDNMGTGKGSRSVQLANGRASILVKLNNGESVISVRSDGFKTDLLALSSHQPIESRQPAKLGTSNLFSVPSAENVKEIMTRVADWQLDSLPEPKMRPNGDLAWYEHYDWTNAAFYTGIMAHWQTTGEQKYLDQMIAFAEEVNWMPGKRLLHADDHVIGQMYAEIYLYDNTKANITPIIETFDTIMSMSLHGKDLWWWCDALYMAPPTLTRLYKITGDKKYLDFMDNLWWESTDFLFDPEEKLYYRDDRYRIKSDGSGRREKNGKKVFWGRGNGWVMGGLVRVLQDLPHDYPSRPRYEALFKEMASRIVEFQGGDGLWHTSLLNPEGHGESSGTAFYTYALAWGVNKGLLCNEIYMPYALRGWHGLTNIVHPSGKLGWTQQIGHGPAEIHEDMWEVYGAGAFLLAGSEIIKFSAKEEVK
jgi:beta-galactosidase